MTTDEKIRLCAPGVGTDPAAASGCPSAIRRSVGSSSLETGRKARLSSGGRHGRFRPEDLLRIYAAQPEALLRGFLHMLLHCLYLHPFSDHAGEALWDTACDLTVERIIEGLDLPRLGKKAAHSPGAGQATPHRPADLRLSPGERPGL